MVFGGMNVDVVGILVVVVVAAVAELMIVLMAWGMHLMGFSFVEHQG
jgi:hypothetical protein